MDWKKIYRRELKDNGLVRSLFAAGRQNRQMAEIIRARGIISFPHTGLRFSGRMLAQVVRHLYRLDVAAVIALGVLHQTPRPYKKMFSRLLRDSSLIRRPEYGRMYENLRGGFLPSGRVLSTPFGDLPLIKFTASQEFFLRTNREAVAEEFSLDTFFAFLRYYANQHRRAPISVLPIYIKLTKDYQHNSFFVARQLARLLHWFVRTNKRTAIVCTGDMLHYGYGYTDEVFGRQAMAGKPTDYPGLKKHFRPQIEKVLNSALIQQDYDQCLSLGWKMLNDQRQILPILGEYFAGRGKYKIFQFELSDYSTLLQKPKPCCVASVFAGFYFH